MKKQITSVITAALILASLTACNANNEPISDSSNNSSAISDNSSNDLKTGLDDPNSYDDHSQTGSGSDEIISKFEWVFDDPIDFSNAVAINYDLEKIPLSELAKGNWAAVNCNYVYLAEPVGIFYNSIDNSDIYDKENLTFGGAPENALYNYKRYEVGNKFGDLTLTIAETEFNTECADSSPRYFNGGTAWFDGQITLTGFCAVALGDGGYILERDIHFIPDEKSSALPIMNYYLDEGKNAALFSGMESDLCWLSEYFAPVLLGNANDYSGIDLSGLPEDGSFVKVEVTIENLICRGAQINARLLDLKII